MSELTDKLRRLVAEWQRRAEDNDKSAIALVGCKDPSAVSYHVGRQQVFAYCSELVESLLAEHAGDEVAVDDAWISGVFGFSPHAWLHIGKTSLRFAMGDGFVEPIIDCREESDGKIVSCILLPPCRTRGDVKRLCAALGKPIGGES